jgi:hypothetical protein
VGDLLTLTPCVREKFYWRGDWDMPPTPSNLCHPVDMENIPMVIFLKSFARRAFLPVPFSTAWIT